VSKEAPNNPNTDAAGGQFIAALLGAEYWIQGLVEHPLARWHAVGGPEDAVIGITDAEVLDDDSVRRLAVSRRLGRATASGEVTSVYGLREHGEPLFVTWPADAAPEDVVFFDQQDNERTAPDFDSALELTTLLPDAQPINIEPFDPLTPPNNVPQSALSRYFDVLGHSRINPYDMY
jgi:hypothetical protein